MLLAATPTTITGCFNARWLAAAIEFDIPIRYLLAGLYGLMVAQISDIRIGSTIKRGYLDSIVNKVHTSVSFKVS